jgi:hypothetical protein
VCGDSATRKALGLCGFLPVRRGARRVIDLSRAAPNGDEDRSGVPFRRKTGRGGD